MNYHLFTFSILTILLGMTPPVSAMPKWDDIFYSSGPNKAWSKLKFEEMTEEQAKSCI